MDIPSLFMIPSAVSSGKVHSVFPNSTDADFDFNRDSSATRVNSQGLIEEVGYFGAERVTNGGFATDSNWEKGTGWSISGGKANSDGSQTGTSALYQDAGLSIGTVYKATVTISNYSNGNIRILMGGSTFGEWVSGNGKKTFILTQSFDARIYVQADANFIGSIDNVSAVEVTGDRARLNYEIEGGLVNTKPSLLLEPQSTNLLPYSENFSNWSTINATSTSNYSVSPSGELNAARFLTSGESNSYLYVTGISTTASQEYTVSFYVKSNNNGLDDFKIYTSLAGGDSIVFTATENWQRFDHTVTATSTSIFVGLRGVSGKQTDVLVYGAQFEQQSYPTSLIITNGSTQTRAAETCNGAGTSSIFESSEGILYAEFAALADDGNIKHISLSDGSTNNRIIIAIDENNDVRFYYQGTGGSVLVSFSNQSLLFSKIAIRYKSGNFCYYINGAKVGANTSAISFSGLNDLSFNNPYQGGTSPLYGKIRDIRVYNTKEMTDSEVDILLTKITS